MTTMKRSRPVAVVTGAGSGIGRATALELAGRGCALALVDVNADGLAATEAGGRGARRPRRRSTSPTCRDADRMAELARRGDGPPRACNILVNNAGVLTVGRFADDTLDNIRWIVGINVFGVIHGCHYFLPLLREADEAHIVNVSSMAAFVGIPQNAVYSLTKGAVRSFTEALRAELVGTNIGVSALFPGSTDTNIMRGSRGVQAGAPQPPRQDRSCTSSAAHPKPPPARSSAPSSTTAPASSSAPTPALIDITARILPGRTGLIGRALDLVTR